MGEAVTFIIGIIICILAISNMRGNISSLHSYHRSRVAPEDVIPFGKLVGLGTVIMGASIILFGTLSIISVFLDKSLLVWIGTALMVIGMTAGAAIAFYAMKKYNKGVF